jgi:hypothetical protein
VPWILFKGRENPVDSRTGPSRISELTSQSVLAAGRKK